MALKMNHHLPSGYVLTVAVAVGDPAVGVSQVEDSTIATVIKRGSQTFGPYLYDSTFTVIGTATVTSAVSGSISTTFPLSSNAGAPVSAVRASANINPAGDDNGLTFTAVEYGTGGNTIAVQYVDPGAASQSLAVSVVSGNLIRVSLATNGGAAITSTAAAVLAAVNASPAASALATASIYAADDGVADDGSGVVTAMARTSLSGGAGTGIGSSPPGSLCVDTTNGVVYKNRGTSAAPIWVAPGEFATTYVPFASAVSVTTNTAKDVCTLALTAGEWDVDAVLERNLTAVTATRYAGSISLTADTVAPAGGGSGLGTSGTVTQFATFGTEVTGSFATVIPPTRLVIAAATTIHLVVIDLFSAGTLTAFGTLRARRVY